MQSDEEDRPRCATCICYHFMNVYGGQCRMHPPVVVLAQYPTGTQIETVWPAVQPEEWCVQHKEKKR